MKRAFLGTTALVAAAGVAGVGQAQADGIELGLGGYMNTFFSAGSIDRSSPDTPNQGVFGKDTRDFNPTGLFSDGEIDFSGSYTADNGMRFGVDVQLEMFGDVNSGGDTIDERYMWMQSAFGRLELGSTNSAAYQMHYAAPFVGVPINSGWITVFVPMPNGFLNAFATTGFQAPFLSTYLDFGNDENLISYYTPRIAGFQLGVSYAPSIVNTGDGKNFPVEANLDNEYANGVSVGLNYVEDFNGFGVAVSGGWRWANIPNSLTGNFDNKDYQSVSGGAQFSYAGFTLGGSYANELDGYAYSVNEAGDFSTEGYAWDVGASYDWGPWHYGVTYFRGNMEGFNNSINDLQNDNNLRAVSGGVAFDIGPGIQLSGSVMWAKYHDEFGYSSSGIVGVIGSSLSF